MKIKTKEKVFDAVKFMREQRDQISKDISNLNFQELKEYLKARNRQEIKPSA